ncbi:MAG: M20/M25/M40 family metallo-hydrolase [Gaiellaceae bacterium]
MSTAVDERWLAELDEFLAIPSFSTDPAHREHVVAAAAWVVGAVHRSGGAAEIVQYDDQPLVLGEIRASHGRDAPTVLVYGHFDVQPIGNRDDWAFDPLRATVDGEWVYGRGVADDKGQLLMLLTAAARLAAANALPVHVRLVADGEEEVGGTTVARWLASEQVDADACLIFDAGMSETDVPAFYLGTRGIWYAHVRVQTAPADLHSGIYGGAALNAVHVLNDMLAAVVPRNGRVPVALRAGTAPPSQRELDDWAALRPGEAALGDVSARPSDSAAAEEFYARTFAEPSLDVHALGAGEPGSVKTIVPAAAMASLSMRLAYDQDAETIGAAVQALLREAAPPTAEVDVEVVTAVPPALVPPDSPAVALAAAAFERALGRRPLMLRSGGSLPILPALTARSVPAIVTGFAEPQSNVHAPDERIRLRYLPLGVAAARETLIALGTLPSGGAR